MYAQFLYISCKNTSGKLPLSAQPLHIYDRFWAFPGSKCSLCFLQAQSLMEDVSGPGSHCFTGILQEQFQMQSSSNIFMAWPLTEQHLLNQVHISSPLTVSLNIWTITILWVLSVNFSTLNMEKRVFTFSNLVQKSFSKLADLKLTSSTSLKLFWKLFWSTHLSWIILTAR